MNLLETIISSRPNGTRNESTWHSKIEIARLQKFGRHILQIEHVQCRKLFLDLLEHLYRTVKYHIKLIHIRITYAIVNLPCPFEILCLSVPAIPSASFVRFMKIATKHLRKGSLSRCSRALDIPTTFRKTILKAKIKIKYLLE